MASGTRQVWDALDRDLFARAALERGLLNYRALARDLRHRLNLTLTEAGTVSAIQRYAEREAGDDPLGGAERVMRDLRITTRTHVVSVALRKQSETLALLPKLFNMVDWSKGEQVRVVQAEESVKVILDHGNLDQALRLIPPQRVLGTRTGLAELSIRLSPEAMETPGCLLMILSGLYARRINVWELLMATPEVLIFIGEEDLAPAHEAIMQFARASPSRPAPRVIPARVRRTKRAMA